MKVTSEGPIKITKAKIDAAWRRRTKDHRLIVRDKDCRGLALIVNPTVMTWSYAYRARERFPDRPTLAEQVGYAGQPRDALGRRCPRGSKSDQGTGRCRR